MIELRGITQTYQGSQGPVEALKGIDLTIQPGEVFGIIGKSGAGKSSLVRVINLLNRPSTGQVIVGGQDLTQLNDAQLRVVQLGQVLPAHDDLARGGPVEQVDHPHQRAFARAALADDAEHFARLDGEVDALERLDRAL